MASSRKPAKRVKAGNSEATAEKRRIAFVDAYLLNGRNGTRAALTAGYSPKGAPTEGCRLLKNPKILAILADREAELAAKAGLSLDRTLKEIARLAYADPRKMFDAQGNPKAIADLDDDSAATLAGFEISEEKTDGEVTGYVKKFKMWDKKGALDMAMRFHGAYEADNKQKPAAVVVSDDMELARRVAYMLSSADKTQRKAA